MVAMVGFILAVPMHTVYYFLRVRDLAYPHQHHHPHHLK